MSKSTSNLKQTPTKKRTNKHKRKNTLKAKTNKKKDYQKNKNYRPKARSLSDTTKPLSNTKNSKKVTFKDNKNSKQNKKKSHSKTITNQNKSNKKHKKKKKKVTLNESKSFHKNLNTKKTKTKIKNDEYNFFSDDDTDTNNIPLKATKLLGTTSMYTINTSNNIRNKSNNNLHTPQIDKRKKKKNKHFQRSFSVQISESLKKLITSKSIPNGNNIYDESSDDDLDDIKDNSVRNNFQELQRQKLLEIAKEKEYNLWKKESTPLTFFIATWNVCESEFLPKTLLKWLCICTYLY